MADNDSPHHIFLNPKTNSWFYKAHTDSGHLELTTVPDIETKYRKLRLHSTNPEATARRHHTPYFADDPVGKREEGGSPYIFFVPNEKVHL